MTRYPFWEPLLPLGSRSPHSSRFFVRLRAVLAQQPSFLVISAVLTVPASLAMSYTVFSSEDSWSRIAISPDLGASSNGSSLTVRSGSGLEQTWANSISFPSTPVTDRNSHSEPPNGRCSQNDFLSRTGAGLLASNRTPEVAPLFGQETAVP